VDRAMQDLPSMATRTFDYDLHDHAGARWLAGATLPVLFVVLTGILMLAYPHL
jgi:hypothetical protein